MRVSVTVGVGVVVSVCFRPYVCATPIAKTWTIRLNQNLTQRNQNRKKNSSTSTITIPTTIITTITTYLPPLIPFHSH